MSDTLGCPLVCHFFFVLNTLQHHLQSITKQKHGNMEPIRIEQLADSIAYQLKCLGWKVYRVTLSNDSDHNSWCTTEKGHKWAHNTNSSVKDKFENKILVTFISVDMFVPPS